MSDKNSDWSSAEFQKWFDTTFSKWFVWLLRKERSLTELDPDKKKQIYTASRKKITSAENIEIYGGGAYNRKKTYVHKIMDRNYVGADTIRPQNPK